MAFLAYKPGLKLRKTKSQSMTRSVIIQRMLRAILALVFMAWHAYVALIVYSEAMLNEPIRFGTPLATGLQFGLGSAVIISLLLVIGSVAGWRNRTFLMLGTLLALAWSTTVWLI
jgi:hypothetical protein